MIEHKITYNPQEYDTVLYIRLAV